ncbi:MAG: putative Flagellar biosynthetic protein FlhF, binding [Nitrospira sp.]|jgi:flagellar biosynthesis protein FlhF|nr:putative Flagellar biosynthetic protein FlhF, binding [Nitrospira sp.]
MKVRTFHVKSMQEAIRSIKDTLGPDAVILSTKRVRSWDNGFGLLGGSVLEVMAAIEDDAAVPSPAPSLAQEEQSHPPLSRAPALPAEESRFQRTLQGAMETFAEKPKVDSRPASVLTGNFPPAHGRPQDRTGNQGTAIHSFQRVYEDLLAQGVEQLTAEGCLRELQETLVDPGSSQRSSSLQLLRTVLLSRIKTAGPLLSAGGEQKVALFIGPSGVGKTSTIAKLATQYGIVEQRSIALITMDTFRPAAVEHLRLYAEVLGIELAVAGSCEAARAAIDHAREAELVLIDTAGFNPYESVAAQRWRGLVNDASPIEAHLVLAAGTRVPDLVVSVSQCVDVPSLRLLFTKLDETTGYGGIFEATHRTGVPLSYWGTGQRVPDDLMQAQVDRLGDLLLGGQVKAPMQSANQTWDRQIEAAIRPGITMQAK